MEPLGCPVRVRSGSRFVTAIVAVVLLMVLLPGCKAEEELPPVFQWVWSGTAPAGITAVEACGVGGPSVIASADGTVRKADAAGATAWEIVNPGLEIVSVSVDDAGSTVAVVTATPAGTEAPAPDVLTVYGAAGNGLWQAASPAEGLTIGGSVSADGTKVLVTCGKSRFELPAMTLEDYPALPSVPAATGTIDPQLFTEAIGQVASCLHESFAETPPAPGPPSRRAAAEASGSSGSSRARSPSGEAQTPSRLVGWAPGLSWLRTA